MSCWDTKSSRREGRYFSTQGKKLSRVGVDEEEIKLASSSIYSLEGGRSVESLLGRTITQLSPVPQGWILEEHKMLSRTLRLSLYRTMATTMRGFATTSSSPVVRIAKSAPKLIENQLDL